MEAIMWIADNWKDYEVLDTSNGEKLERWGDYILVRPDPQGIWNTPHTHKGWKRKKNQNYWQLFDKVYNRAKKFCSDIKFEWTKGHNTNEYNNLADRLAVEDSHFAD